MLTLDSFQHDAALALNDPTRQSPQNIAGRTIEGSSRRFNIYRNNRAGSLLESLQGTYPVLHKLLGDDFFRTAARQYIDESPPSGPVLSEYGERFGDFIQRLPGVSKYPYLNDVAKLEWQRLQSYHAADDAVLFPAVLQTIEPSTLLASRFTPHSAAHLIESRWAIGSLWSSTQEPDGSQVNLSQAENVLITRPQFDLQLQLVSSDGAMFMRQLCNGVTIEQAATHCLSVNANFDTGTHLQGLMGMGAFSQIIH